MAYRYRQNISDIFKHFLNRPQVVGYWIIKTLHVLTESQQCEGCVWWVYAIRMSVSWCTHRKDFLLLLVTTLVYSLDCFIMMTTLSLQNIKRRQMSERILHWRGLLDSVHMRSTGCFLSLPRQGSFFQCFISPCRKSIWWFSKVHLKVVNICQ